MEMAKALIDVAAQSKADAVKFQTFKPGKVYVPNAGKSEYLSEAGIKKPITEIFKDLSMPYSMLPELAAYAKGRGILFMSSVFSVESAEAVNPYVKIHKNASYEITHSRLIKFLAETGKPLVMSTGGADCEDIKWALNHFYQNGGKKIVLMQCTAKYPAPINTLNLRAIPELIKKFNVPVGLSDHSRDPIVGPVGAVALGAAVIEKHFTLHNRLPGPDHSFALTPGELEKMVKAIRSCEQALGTGQKEPQAEEQELRN